MEEDEFDGSADALLAALADFTEEQNADHAARLLAVALRAYSNGIIDEHQLGDIATLVRRWIRLQQQN